MTRAPAFPCPDLGLDPRGMTTGELRRAWDRLWDALPEPALGGVTADAAVLGIVFTLWSTGVDGSPERGRRAALRAGGALGYREAVGALPR